MNKERKCRYGPMASITVLSLSVCALFGALTNGRQNRTISDMEHRIFQLEAAQREPPKPDTLTP